jgi:hypothetical protein
MTRSYFRDLTFDVGGGMRISNGVPGAKKTLSITVADEYSGIPILEFNLDAEQVLMLLSGHMGIKVEGSLAIPDWLDNINHKRVQSTITPPYDIYAQVYDTKRTAAIISEWFEEQPESAGVHGFAPRHPGGTEQWVVDYWTWVPREKYEADQVSIAESEEVDFDDDGDDDEVMPTSERGNSALD